MLKTKKVFRLLNASRVAWQSELFQQEGPGFESASQCGLSLWSLLVLPVPVNVRMNNYLSVCSFIHSSPACVPKILHLW